MGFVKQGQGHNIATALYKSCPSAGMELLRMGKIIGPDKDKLSAADNHNWQLVTYAKGQQGYVDLADPSVVKHVLSDADFPYWLGWQKKGAGLFAGNGQCDMHDLLGVLKVSRGGEGGQTARQQLRDYFGDPEHRHVRAWAQRLVCQYPSEWDKSNNARCGKLKEKGGLGPGKDGPYVGNDAEYQKHMQFVEALQWWGDAGLGSSNVWHFHPFGFVRQFRKCGWLSLRELAQVVQGGQHRTITSVANRFVSELRDKHDASRIMRPGNLHAALMRCMRKYGIVTAPRQAFWFGQILHETGQFQYMRELGSDAYFTALYEGRCRSSVQRIVDGKMQTQSPLGNCNFGDGIRFSGKGMIQITGGDNYRNYQAYRGGTNFTVDPGPESLVTDPYNACDTGGFYWISKQRYFKDPVTHRLVPLKSATLNYWSDAAEPITLNDEARTNKAIDDITRLINTALDGKENRRTYFKHSYSHLSDMTCRFPSEYKPLRD